MSVVGWIGHGRDVRGGGPGRDLVGRDARQEPDPIGGRQRGGLGLEPLAERPARSDDEQHGVGDLGHRPTQLLHAATRGDVAEDEHDPIRGPDAQPLADRSACDGAVESAAPADASGPLNTTAASTPTVRRDDVGVRLVGGDRRVGGTRPGAFAAGEQPPPRAGQSGEPGALDLEIARVVDRPTPEPPAQGEGDRQGDHPLGLPDVGTGHDLGDPIGPLAGQPEVADRLGRAADELGRSAEPTAPPRRSREPSPGPRHALRWPRRAGVGVGNQRSGRGWSIRSSVKPSRSSRSGSPSPVRATTVTDQPARAETARELPGSRVGDERVVEQQHDPPSGGVGR